MKSFGVTAGKLDRLPNMADNNGTNVMEAIGGETRSPPQGSLKRHVYCTTGDSDFLSMEKALQGWNGLASKH